MLNKRNLFKILATPLKISQFIIGLLVFGLGLGALLVWHFGKLDLGADPLIFPFQSALGLFICGIVILFNLTKYYRLSFAFQMLIIGVGFAGILEYLGIDQLLKSIYRREHDNTSEQISLVITISFIITGIAFYLLSDHKKDNSIIASTLGLTAVVFGVVALTGYFFEMPHIAGWESSSLVIFSALGTTMLGSGILISAWNQNRTFKAEVSPWRTEREAENISIKTRLHLLADECGDEALQEIVSIFFEESLAKIMRLQQLIYQPDKFYLIAREAHTLRGSCLNFGALKMAELSSKLERAASAQDVEDVSSIINQLNCEFNRTCSLIKLGIQSTITVK